jgi:hypothetical protein
MEDDDVGIAGGSGQRGDCPHSKALLGELVGQGSASALLDEKNANGVRLADGGEQYGGACFQGHDSSIEPSWTDFDVFSWAVVRCQKG